jgi:hypothetical protein
MRPVGDKTTAHGMIQINTDDALLFDHITIQRFDHLTVLSNRELLPRRRRWDENSKREKPGNLFLSFIWK